MNISIFDPGLSDHSGNQSRNLGDLIIQEAVLKEIRKLFPDCNILNISTHSYPYSEQINLIRNSDYIFVGGTNLLGSRLFFRKQWKLSFLQKIKIGRAILLGVGWGKYDKLPNFFSKLSLKTVLSSSILHSVRDEYTKQMLKSAGITNVLNTGCPTMWEIDSIDQSSIPQSKSNNALVMLTDYSPSFEADRRFLELVNKHYETIYFWPQGKEDLQYLSSLRIEAAKPFVILDHNYNSFLNFINSDLNFDYIGTRLHGGIKCINAKKRSLILKIDNRATEIAKDTGLPSANRDDLVSIQKWILGTTPTNITINIEAINIWKRQFVI